MRRNCVLFFQSRDQPKWIGQAIDRLTKMRVGFWIGECDPQEARALFLSCPLVYRQCAVCDTDDLVSYVGALLLKYLEKSVGKLIRLKDFIPL